MPKTRALPATFGVVQGQRIPEWAVTPNDVKDVPSLVRSNGKITCPNCAENGKPDSQSIGRVGKEFKPMRLVERYKLDLVQVIQHDKNHGGCGHIFALGDAKIMIAFMEGRLIPKELYDELMEKYTALLAEGESNPTTSEVTV